MKIPFNKVYLTGDETSFMAEAALSGKISGNGPSGKKVSAFFKEKYGLNHTLITTSCTDALEMAALLCGIKEGDEVIVPSYTFVSTANAFALRGASIVFADSSPDHPNLDAAALEGLISEKTKAIVPVHYGGAACDMGAIARIAQKHGLFVVEDAAQAIDSFYEGKPLGGLGDLGAFSFHETKNIVCGEGGLLSVNRPEMSARAEILYEKGTNRASFARGETDKYNWVDLGSSFLASEITAAFLRAQLAGLENIQEKRSKAWRYYFEALRGLQWEGRLALPKIPPYANHGAHLFYIVCKSPEERAGLAAHLAKNGISAIPHYYPLHLSPYAIKHYGGISLPNAENFALNMLRLPFFTEISEAEQSYVAESVRGFY